MDQALAGLVSVTRGNHPELRSGAPKFTMLDALDERVVFGVGEQERRILWLLGVADGHKATVQECHLDAVRPAAAEAAGAPLRVSELCFEPSRVDGVPAHARSFPDHGEGWEEHPRERGVTESRTRKHVLLRGRRPIRLG